MRQQARDVPFGSEIENHFQVDIFVQGDEVLTWGLAVNRSREVALWMPLLSSTRKIHLGDQVCPSPRVRGPRPPQSWPAAWPGQAAM